MSASTIITITVVVELLLMGLLFDIHWRANR